MVGVEICEFIPQQGLVLVLRCSLGMMTMRNCNKDG